MHCSTCGTQFPPDNTLCPKCGAVQQVAASPQAPLALCRACGRVLDGNTARCSYCSAPQTPTRRFNWGAIGVLVAVLIIAFVAALFDRQQRSDRIVVQGGSGYTRLFFGPRTSLDDQHEAAVTYSVTGSTGVLALVTYTNADGTIEEAGSVLLPWRHSFIGEPGAALSVTAQNMGEDGTVSCTIRHGTTVIDEVTMPGGYGVAECSGSVP